MNLLSKQEAFFKKLMRFGRLWVGTILLISLILNILIDLSLSSSEAHFPVGIFNFYVNSPIVVGLLVFAVDEVNRYTGQLGNETMKFYFHFSETGRLKYVYPVFIASAITLNIFHFLLLKHGIPGKGLIFVVLPVYASLIGLAVGGVSSFIWYLFERAGSNTEG